MKTTNEIAVEYRNIAHVAVRLLKTIPFTDVRQRVAVASLFDRLADNDIALQAHVDAANKQEAEPKTDA